MSTHNIYHFQSIKENHPKFSQICNYGIFSKGLNDEFEPAIVNEPSVFEPLKFYCSNIFILRVHNNVVEVFLKNASRLSEHVI